MQQQLNSNILLGVLLSLIFIGAFATTGGVNLSTKEPEISTAPVTIVVPSGEQSKDNLQLQTFGYVTPHPTIPQKTTCKPDSIREKGSTCACPSYEVLSVVCKEKPCPAGTIDWWRFENVPDAPPAGCAYWPVKDFKLIEQKKKDPLCQEACLGKPVIYLYPVEDTMVDVEIVTPGRIYISDPEYPVGGWKDVLAHPDGRLEYQQKNYHELYYETEVAGVKQPKNGIIIPTEQLEEKLSSIVTQLGLKQNERDEFLEYWLPKLYELESPYILFSVLDREEKERVDHVNISPKPDTFIDFIAYFKPLYLPYAAVVPLILPQDPPQRIGFTAVEWGGTIDY